MAFSGWRKSGSNALLSKDGKGYWCEQCPCVDCWRTLREAIYERQLANTGTATIDVDKEDYTIGEYRTFIKGFAGVFIDGAFTGGASPPTLVNGTVVDSMTECVHLLSFVADMVTSYKVPFGGSALYTNPRYYEGYGRSGWYEDALRDAEDDFQEVYPPVWMHEANSTSPLYLREVVYDFAWEQALIACGSMCMWQQNLTTALRKSVSFWSKWYTPTYSTIGTFYIPPERKTWSSPGFGVVENEYHFWELKDVGYANEAISSVRYPALEEKPPSWPAQPPMRAGALVGAKTGYFPWTDWLPLINWDFSIT